METSLVPAHKEPTWQEGKMPTTAEKEGQREGQGVSRKGCALGRKGQEAGEGPKNRTSVEE